MLSLSSVEGSVISHLTEILLLTLLSRSEKRVVVGVEESAPILQHTLLIGFLCIVVTGIDQREAGVGELRLQTIGEFGLHFTFLVGLCVILHTLHTIDQGIVGRLVERNGVKRLLF